MVGADRVAVTGVLLDTPQVGGEGVRLRVGRRRTGGHLDLLDNGPMGLLGGGGDALDLGEQCLGAGEPALGRRPQVRGSHELAAECIDASGDVVELRSVNGERVGHHDLGEDIDARLPASLLGAGDRTRGSWPA